MNDATVWADPHTAAHFLNLTAGACEEEPNHSRRALAAGGK